MENIFRFNYKANNLRNLDGTDSRFAVVYGQDGQIISCKKDSYKVVQTEDVNLVAQEFLDRGYKVTPYVYKHGEKIGLNIPIGEKPSVVGKSSYNFHLHIPNNGTGMGYLKLFQKRLVCSNGMTRTISADKMKGIRIPHTWDYQSALNLAKDVIGVNIEIITQTIEQDEELNKQLIDKNELTYELNKWFYEKEMPANHKKDMSFKKFREILYSDPEKIKCLDRYTALMHARNAELKYNRELNLGISKYTVLAAVTNYLSRRIEKSQSSAPKEIQYERAQSKIESLINI